MNREGLADYLRSHPHPGGIIVAKHRKFIYMKAARTGGTSILRGAIEQTIGGICHRKLKKDKFARWLRQLTDEELQNYFIFTFIRNPWDRAVSLATAFKMTLPQFAQIYAERITQGTTFRHHVTPLHHYTHNNGKQFADYIGRFENLQSDYDDIMAMLNIKSRKLPHLKTTQHQPYRECYDEQTKTTIEEIYKTDIQLYGYKF